MIDRTLRQLKELKSKIAHLERIEQPRWIYLSAPLTSTSWDGDAYSTTAKTLIDLSAVFGVPAGVKAVYVKVCIRDAASTGGLYYIFLSANDTAASGLVLATPRAVNDEQVWQQFVVPCSANGDIYYQISASGAGTMDVWIEVFGYLL